VLNKKSGAAIAFVALGGNQRWRRRISDAAIQVVLTALWLCGLAVILSPGDDKHAMKFEVLVVVYVNLAPIAPDDSELGAPRDLQIVVRGDDCFASLDRDCLIRDDFISHDRAAARDASPIAIAPLPGLF
jgi:hypothetical protein